MRRLVVKRWLAIVLTLIVLFTSGVFVPSRARADSGTDPITIGDNGGGSPPAGDPDGPAGPTKRIGRSVRNGTGYAAPSVGDGGSVMSVWKWRIQVVLQALRIRSARF